MQVQYLGKPEITEVDDVVAVMEFLEESNIIEGVWDEDSLKQAKYAWDYLIEQPKLNGGVILKTHKILMLHQKLRPNERGYWRRCAVYIGGREGKDWRYLPTYIADWLEYKVKRATTEEAIKQCHVDYEVIHPFVDGNGRTGRMFMNYQRLKAGLPLLIIPDADKQSYYEWFK